jgi:hypothetical protein
MASNISKGVRDKYGAPNTNQGWELHIAGCLGEVATAKYLNLFWCGSLGDYSAKDVGGLVQVRTRQRSDYELPLHPPDSDSDPFVLCFVRPPIVELKGWILGSEGKLPEYWKDPAGNRPAFFVPHDKLRPMPDLVTHIANLKMDTIK